MRSLSSTFLAVAMFSLAACAPAYEDGHLSRNINHQRELRDKCLAREAVSLDDHRSMPEIIGRSAALACSTENDKLIQLMSTMDRSGEAQITDAVRKDSVLKATSYVLSERGASGQ